MTEAQAMARLKKLSAEDKRALAKTIGVHWRTIYRWADGPIGPLGLAALEKAWAKE